MAKFYPQLGSKYKINANLTKMKHTMTFLAAYMSRSMGLYLPVFI